MLGCLVQALDLVDEQLLVVAGHGHAQDQLEEAGDILHLENIIVGWNVGDWQIVSADALLTQIVAEM